MKILVSSILFICCLGLAWSQDELEVDFVSGNTDPQIVARLTDYIDDVLSSYGNPDFEVEVYADPEYGRVIHVTVSATNRFDVRADSGRWLSILAAIGTVAEVDPQYSWAPYSADRCIITFDNMDLFCSFDSLEELLACDNADANASGEWARANITYQEHTETAEDFINEGFAAAAQEDYAQAAAHFEAALTLEPSNPMAQLGRGAIHLEEGQYDYAKLYANMLIDNYPNGSYAYIIRGAACMYLGEYEEALSDYETCMTIDTSTVAETLYWISCLYALQDDVSMSMQYLEQAVDAGYTNLEWVNNDPDFESIRGTQEFIEGLDRITLKIGEN